MKRRDRAIVGVILAAALIGGLVLVSRALSQAAQAQADSLAAAQFNGGTGAASSPSVQTDGPQVGAGASSGDLSEPEHSGGEVGTDQPEQGEGDASSDGSGTESTQPGGSGESGSAAETPAAPSAGGGAKTLDELSRWMQNESSGALAAQSQLQAEQALAAGIGTADDALRRTFAQSQAQANDQARRNQLAEEAAALGLDYLRCRDLVALREESVAFYQALEETIGAQTGGEGQEIAQADLQTVQEALAEAELALEEAQASLQAARDELNGALGNPYGTAIQVTDDLQAEELPALTQDEAAAQALSARNEIKAASYQVQKEQETLTQLRYSYAPNSPEVLEQQAALQQAQAASAEAGNQVEADVRDRLTRLELQEQALALCLASLEKTGSSAPETPYTLTQGEDGGSWSSNLSQLMEQWAAIESSLAELTSGIAQFNLDVLCFQHAVGVGCTAAEI